MGAALFAEYESLTARVSVLRRCSLTKSEREAVLDGFLSTCEWVKVYYTWRPNLPDEADNHLVELAVAGAARGIVTHNVRDFRRAELRFSNLGVFTPAQWLRQFS
jgi:predicted nucleic acid-binding protein